MWQIVHGTYFERVGRRGIIPHGPGSIMNWTDAQAESYGLERLRKIAEAEKPVTKIDALREQAKGLGIAVDRRWGVERLQKEIANANTASSE
jgi:hypothetical protein